MILKCAHGNITRYLWQKGIVFSLKNGFCYASSEERVVIGKRFITCLPERIKDLDVNNIQYY